MQNTPSPNTPQDNIPTDSQPPVTNKRRHGCLTAWLILIIITNIVNTILVIYKANSEPWNYPYWVIPVQSIFGLWSIICVIALFMWKKWGFYGFLAVAFASMIANIVTGSYVYAFTPFIGVLCLFGVLNIGGDKRGWPQLE